MIVYFLLIFYLFSALLSVLANRELFTPVKFYFLSILLYFLDVFLSPQLPEIYIIYFCYILFGLLLIFLEKKLIANFKYTMDRFRERKSPTLVNPNIIFTCLLFLTIIPILSQYYMISLSGGIQEYFVSMKLRVISWSGLGYIYILRDFLPIINLIFFMILIIFDFKNKKSWVIVYIFHLILTLLISGMTGSRSAVLNTILFNIIAYHYLVKPIKLRILIISFFALIVSSTILYSARQQVNFDGDKISLLNENFDLLESLKERSTSIYGIIPLNIIYSSEFNNFQYGLTYLTSVSNFIPKFIWPGKPASSGIILTKFYWGANYEGSTNFSTGIVAEGVMNYGYALGPFIGFFLGLILAYNILKVFRLLRRYLKKSIIDNSVKIKYEKIIKYIFLIIVLLPQIGNATMSESNNLGFNFIKQILFYLIIDFLIFKLIKLNYYEK